MIHEKTNRKRILVVDDEEAIGRLIERILKRTGHECSVVLSAEEARDVLKEESFDLILCDIHLPGESGVSLIEHVISIYPDTAVIMVTAEDDPDTVEKALEIGAYGYIVKPFQASELIINVASALRRRKLEVESRNYRDDLERIVADRTAKLEQTLDGVIRVVGQSVETRDLYTAGHQRRVADLACAIAEEMGGISTHQIKGIRMAGMIHDLGKLSVPAEILSKPARLNDLEFAIVKGHSKVGHDILEGIEFPWPIAETVYQHHERLNGSGYPRCLEGDEIILEARIIAVADVMEAMATHRPYRPSLGIEVALEEIVKNKGIFYDDAVADACLRLFEQNGYQFPSP